jgi:hypothetical protein
MPNVNGTRSSSFATGFLTALSASSELGTVMSSLSNVSIFVTRNWISRTTPVRSVSPYHSVQSPIWNGSSRRMNTPATKLESRSCIAKPTASERAPSRVAKAPSTTPNPATVAATPQRDEQGNRRHDAPGKPSDFLTEPPRAKCSLRESNQRDPGDRIDDEERHEEDRNRDGEANQRRAVLIDDLIYQLLGVGRDR